MESFHRVKLQYAKLYQVDISCGSLLEKDNFIPTTLCGFVSLFLVLAAMDTKQDFHVVMFPWLAMGHLIPFFHLSKSLASKGIRISFISTPRNIQRLPKIPSKLSSLITLISLPFSDEHIQNLPENAECSTDLPIEKAQLLRKAFDGLQPSLSTFIRSTKPDWIVHDLASYWLPKISENLGIPCIYFCVFPAPVMAFLGSPSELLSSSRTKPEDYTTVPKWIPFDANIAYRLHEVLEYFKGAPQDESGVPDTHRFAMVIRDSPFVCIRGCTEFESEWLSLLSQLFGKPVIPIGLLPPLMQESEDEEAQDNGTWVEIKEWLDKQKEGCVVYVALGTESVLTQEQVNELAFGLESSELPFFWVLRRPRGSVENSTSLPLGFEERTKGRGIVYMRWAPQVKILRHSSIGGFLTHCGFNSVIEGLSLGRVLILLPMLNDQGLNARVFEGKKVGLEIPRNELDGSFSCESVAESLRFVMVSGEGEVLRKKAKETSQVFGNEKLHDSYVTNFVRYLKSQHKNYSPTSNLQ